MCVGEAMHLVEVETRRFQRTITSGAIAVCVYHTVVLFTAKNICELKICEFNFVFCKFKL